MLWLLIVALLGWAWLRRQALADFRASFRPIQPRSIALCRFVMGFDEAYCRGYVQQWLPLGRLEEDGPQRLSRMPRALASATRRPGRARRPAAACHEGSRVRLAVKFHETCHVQAAPSFACTAAGFVYLPPMPTGTSMARSSRLSFVTGKNGDTAEVHRFLVLHGTVSRKGSAELSIEMDSVSSGIPCATSRCATICSRWRASPKAKREKAQIDLRPLNDLADGAQIELRLPLTVTLHGSRTATTRCCWPPAWTSGASRW